MQGSVEQFFRFSFHWRRLFSGTQLVDGLNLRVHNSFTHVLGILVRWLGHWAQRGLSTTALRVASVAWQSQGSKTRQLDSPRGNVSREPGDTAWPFWSSFTRLVVSHQPVALVTSKFEVQPRFKERKIRPCLCVRKLGKNLGPFFGTMVSKHGWALPRM